MDPQSDQTPKKTAPPPGVGGVTPEVTVRAPVQLRKEPPLAELKKLLQAQRDEIDRQLTSIMTHLAAGGTDTRTPGWKTELSKNFDLIKGILQDCLDKIPARSPVRQILEGGGSADGGSRFIF